MIFSVIVPFLNEEKYIERCIRSLLAQDFDKTQYELIFIDNASCDKSADIAGRIPEVILLHEEKKCSYLARNKGLRVAKGEIIAFTDADCAVSGDWLNSIYREMHQGNTGIALGKCLFPQNASHLLRLFEGYENTKAKEVLGKHPRQYAFGYTRNMAVRSEVFKKYGFFIEFLVQGDTEFVHRYLFRDKDARMVYLNDMEVTHMEIENQRDWFKKKVAYGKHSWHESMPSYRPLNFKIKFDIFNICTKKSQCRYLTKIAFFFMLIIGDIYYKTGRVKGYIKYLVAKGINQCL